MCETKIEDTKESRRPSRACKELTEAVKVADFSFKKPSSSSSRSSKASKKASSSKPSSEDSSEQEESIENIENFVQKVFLADIRLNYQAVLSVSEADLSG